MKRAAAVIGAGLAFALLASPATAAAEMGTTSPMVHRFTQLGLQFWQDRDVTPCEQPTILRADMGPEAHGANVIGTCRIWISGSLINAAQREHWRPLAGGDSAREELCTTIFHEIGHTAGLEHTEDGLMSVQGVAVPWACRQWRVRADRQYRRAQRR